ncbi:hypothetical protein [Thiomicrorhabdus hydrogeniphila]
MKSIIDESSQWKSLNLGSLNFERYEGSLCNSKFNKKLLKSINKYSHLFDEQPLSFQCGFEIEFYINPDDIKLVLSKLVKIIPKFQMILVDLNKVPQTNGKDFYLIGEKTGTPSEGLKSYEFVSPKLDYKTLPYYISKTLKILNRVGATDDENVGFHLHVSTINCKPISPISLIYYLDSLNDLDSKKRKYTRSVVKQFFSYKPQNWQIIFEHIARKCYDVNLLYFSKNNRIEFRSIGGRQYLKDIDLILQSIFNCFEAYNLASIASSEHIAKNIIKRYELDKNIVSLIDVDVKQMKNLSIKDLWLPISGNVD